MNADTALLVKELKALQKLKGNTYGREKRLEFLIARKTAAEKVAKH